MATRKKVSKKTAKRGSSKKKSASKKKVARKKVSRKKVASKKKTSRKKASKKKVAKKKASRKKSTTKKKASKKRVTRKKTAKKKASKKKVSRKKAAKKRPAKKKASRKKTSKKTSKKKVVRKKAGKKKTTSRKKTVSKKKTTSVKKKPAKKATAKKAASKSTANKAAGAAADAEAEAKAVKKIVVKSPQKRFASRTSVAQPMNPADHVPPRPKRRKKVSNDQLIHGIEPYKAAAGEEYMNERQQEHFRKILLAWKRELMEEVDRTVHHMQDEASNFPDPNDRATQESEFSLELRTRDRERKLLKKIEQAIARIDEGEYGYCEETGEEIGLKRLEARPVATLSVEAQERREVAERQYRDSDDRYR